MDMTSGDKLGVALGCTGFICIAAIAWAIAWHSVTTTRLMTEGGYTQQVVPGSGQVLWVRSGQVPVPAEKPR